MVPIIHKACGGQAAWYLRDNGSAGDLFSSKHYMRIDGYQPAYGDIFSEKCAHCGEQIAGVNDLVRDFTDVQSNTEKENNNAQN